jgi:hypothetical protein
MRPFRRASIGASVLVRSPEGEPAYWLVPLSVGTRACGYARVDLGGHVGQVGTLGTGEGDPEGCPEAGFFAAAPPSALAEIGAKYRGKTLGEPIFSYDRSPAKWGWRVTVGDPVVGVVFITPGGWYASRLLDDAAGDREG